MPYVASRITTMQFPLCHSLVRSALYWANKTSGKYENRLFTAAI